jgi:hypothetical protein
MKRRTPYRFSRPAPSTARPPHHRVAGNAVPEEELYYHNGRMRTATFIFLALCAPLAGCSSYSPVTIAVSNAIGEPVSGASIQAAPLYFFNPTDNHYIIVGPYDIMEPFPATGDFGITGDDGTATLRIVNESPLELQVFAVNHEQWEGQIAITVQGDVQIKKYHSRTDLNVTAKLFNRE